MAEKNSRASRTTKRSGAPRGSSSDPEAGSEPIVFAERITVIAETPLADEDATIAGSPDTERAGEKTSDASGDAPGGASSARATAEQRYLMISERAYERARDRGFVPGQELEDWLLAEQEVDARLAGRD